MKPLADAERERFRRMLDRHPHLVFAESRDIQQILDSEQYWKDRASHAEGLLRQIATSKSVYAWQAQKLLGLP